MKLSHIPLFLTSHTLLKYNLQILLNITWRHSVESKSSMFSHSDVIHIYSNININLNLINAVKNECTNLKIKITASFQAFKSKTFYFRIINSVQQKMCVSQNEQYNTHNLHDLKLDRDVIELAFLWHFQVLTQCTFAPLILQY